MHAFTSKRSLKEGLNDLSPEFIRQFELDSKYIDVFKEQMRLTITHNQKEQVRDKRIIRKELSALESKSDLLHKKFIFDGSNKLIYDK